MFPRVGGRAAWLGLCCLLAAAAYLPSLNNGFIADDYVILKRIEILKTQPLFLFSQPPENFRSVSYVLFAAVKTIVGYQSWAFYLLNIGLHCANIILLFRLLSLVIEDEATARLAVLFFGVFQAPQEAVMWLAAMNETTFFFFTLLTLLFWRRERYLAAALVYPFALFSKEAAIIVPLLVVLLDWVKGRLQWQRYLLFLIPSLVFAGVFIFTLSNNFMVTSNSYSPGSHALLVLSKSLNRLLWPWFYILIAITWYKTRQWLPLSRIAGYLGLVIVSMLPYMFIAYQTSLPSRQLYLASAVLMTLFAFLLKPINGTGIRNVVVVVFVAFNIGYLWIRKDRQFEERAAPTNQLVSLLRQNSPRKTVIREFAYPFPDIAAGVAAAASGWDPALISLNPKENCTDCWQLQWNKSDRRYETVAPGK